MCGIAGLICRSGASRDELAQTVTRMTDAIAHRGPDDSGLWIDETCGVALGHRRLSIIDLSNAGHQPMCSPSGRYVLSYNGEIYNHSDLREELARQSCAPEWRGHSDTEVMTAGFDAWGIEGTLNRLNGMFAFALWDRETRTLTLARDRLGEKPLYYGYTGKNLLFASELKALTSHSAFSGEVDREALTLFLRYNYVPAPRSIWHGICKLEPGHFVQIGNGGAQVGEPSAYWRLGDAVAVGAANPLPDEPERVDELEALLKNAVLRRMAADVPLGAFLSGGVDSSTIVALMQAQSSRPVRTFTIGFEDKGFDEAVHAKAVADHLGTDHTEMYVTAADALAIVPKLPQIWDEPFSDSSQIPTYLVSELTRRHVTVSLSGDGGDELFGGYSRYIDGMRLWNAVRRLPRPLRHGLGSGIAHPAIRSLAVMISMALPPRYRHLGLDQRLPKVGQVLMARSADDVYRRLLSHDPDPQGIVLGGQEPGSPESGGPEFSDFRERMMYFDSLGYLPDDILAKVDRATMAVSLEARVPFLDHRVVEYAWRLPVSAKIRNGKGKRILRTLLNRYVPQHLIERPKMGFAIPLSSWLRGPLRDWAEDLLSERRLKDDGFFDPARVRMLWEEELSGKRSQATRLWDILMFQAWWRSQGCQVAWQSPRGSMVVNA